MTNITTLTPKQNKFLKVLKEYIEKKGESPTVKELVKLLKLSSPRAVTQYLDALERKGLIAKSKYQERGIRIIEDSKGSNSTTVTIPVFASAGCDNLDIFAERTYDEYICVASELLQNKSKRNVVSIRATGQSMVDAGINDGDYVLVELTEIVFENDLVVAILDGCAVIKKLELANNAIILKPVSSDPQYRPIILNKEFKIFGKVIDIIRMPQKGDIEVVPLYSSE